MAVAPVSAAVPGGRRMSPPGILRINEGRPFVWIEGVIGTGATGGNLTFTYAAMRCLARVQFPGAGDSGMAAIGVETPSGGWGAFLGIPETTARRHVQSLVERGEVELEDKSRGRNPQWFSFDETDLELNAVGRLRCRVELGPMASARWNGSMRAVWIALGWHGREESGWLSAWPSVARIGAVTGLGKRAVQSGLSRIDDEGLLWRRNTRGASTYILRTRGASVSREEAMERALVRRRHVGRGRKRARSTDEPAKPCALTRHSVHPSPPFRSPQPAKPCTRNPPNRAPGTRVFEHEQRT